MLDKVLKQNPAYSDAMKKETISELVPSIAIVDGVFVEVDAPEEE